MGVYRKLAILTRGTLGVRWQVRSCTLRSTLPYFNFFLTGTVHVHVHLRDI